MKGRIFKDCFSSEQVDGCRWFWHSVLGEGMIYQVGIIKKLHSVFAGNLVKYATWCCSAFDNNAAWQKYFRLSFTRKVRFWQGERTTENTRESLCHALPSLRMRDHEQPAGLSGHWTMWTHFVFFKSFLVFDTVHHPTQISIRVHSSKRQSLIFQALWFDRYLETRASVYK